MTCNRLNNIQIETIFCIYKTRLETVCKIFLNPQKGNTNKFFHSDFGANIKRTHNNILYKYNIQYTKLPYGRNGKFQPVVHKKNTSAVFYEFSELEIYMTSLEP